MKLQFPIIQDTLNEASKWLQLKVALITKNETNDQMKLWFSLMLGSKAVSIPSKEWCFCMIMVKCSFSEV